MPSAKPSSRSCAVTPCELSPPKKNCTWPAGSKMEGWAYIDSKPGMPKWKSREKRRMNVRPLLFLIAFAVGATFAADRPELNGTWQLSSSHEGRLKFETLLIQQTPDGIRISESGAKEKAVDIACGVDGRECKLKEGEISFWYNGPALVMMEMHHNLEVIRVSPPGSISTYTFKKQP